MNKQTKTLNIKKLTLLKGNPDEYYKQYPDEKPQIRLSIDKTISEDSKSYSHKPHLGRLPHDRRTNDPDKLKERAEACKKEESKLEEKIRKIDEELKGMQSTETYDPEEYDYMVDWDYATSGGRVNGFTKMHVEKSDMVGEVEQDMYTFGELDAKDRGVPKDEVRDYVEKEWNNVYEDALDDWFTHLTEDKDIDYFGSGYCDEEGKSKINAIIGRLEKLPIEEGTDMYDERKRTITYLKQIQANSQEEFEESINVGGDGKNNSKIEKLEKEKESLQRKRQDYIDERGRTEDKLDKITSKD